MAQRTLRFASRASVHARPAALFSQAAAGSGVPVRIAKGDSLPGDADQLLISACRALHSSARTVCWLAGRRAVQW